MICLPDMEKEEEEELYLAMSLLSPRKGLAGGGGEVFTFIKVREMSASVLRLPLPFSFWQR